MGALARVAHGLIAAQGGDLSVGTIKRGFRDAVARDPLDSLLIMVLGGSYLFYLAEKDENPKVTSFWDALVFITTCLSVGYADVFARTPAGKAIASVVMTFGPIVSGNALEPPAAERDAEAAKAEQQAAENLEVQRAILARLDAIVESLRAQSAAPPAT
jgi:hypothetical protein